MLEYIVGLLLEQFYWRWSAVVQRAAARSSNSWRLLPDPHGSWGLVGAPGPLQASSQTHTDLKGWSERLDRSRCRLDVSGGALRPAVNVNSTAWAAGVDHDRVLVLGGRLAAAARPDWGEVQGPSRTDGTSLRDSCVIENHEQLNQQRRTQNNRERWFWERRHLVRTTSEAKPTTRSLLESSLCFMSLVLGLVAPSVNDRCAKRRVYELRWISAACPLQLLHAAEGSLKRWRCGHWG